MEKYGVQGEVLYEELRHEEARLMRDMQMLVSDPEKTASDRNRLETQLAQVRNKLTELDLKKTQ